MEHVAALVEPVVAPVDKDSSPSEAPEALSFLLAALPRYHMLMRPGCSQVVLGVGLHNLFN